MTPEAVGVRAEQIEATSLRSDVDRVEISAALVAAREVEGWLQSRVATLVQALGRIDSFPEATITEAAKCSVARATGTQARSETLAETPRLRTELGHGRITAAHVDAVTRVGRPLDDEQRVEFLERADRLATVASSRTVEGFAERLRYEARCLQRTSAEDRLSVQRRNTRLSSWTDGDGMWNLRGRFDPVTGLGLSAAIDDAVETIFAEETPADCPTDPLERQRFVAAHALARLVDVGEPNRRPVGRASRRAEFIAVIDADAPVGRRADGPTVEWPIPIEVPLRVLAELVDDGDLTTVVVRNGVVLHAPGEMNLGRTTRLASRAQRRALRSLYRTCAIPGCSVAFGRCKVHHVVWWRHGGRTDLDNLLPICAVHHARVHSDGWVVTLGPSRQLALTLPDGTVRNTGPPSRLAA